MVSDKKIPKAPGHWLLGNIRDMNADVLGMVEKIRPRIGDIFYVDMVVIKILIITKPDYVKYILQENNKNYIKSFGYEIMKLFLGNGLLTSEGDFWRKQRRLAQPAFHKEKLVEITKQMASSSVALADKLEEVKKQDKEIDITEWMNSVTLDIVAEALFSTDVSKNIDAIRNSLTVANEFAMNRIIAPIKWPLWFPLPSITEFKKAARELDKVVYGFIENHRKDKERKNDLLTMLMDAVDEETGERMSDVQLRDECMTIFLAGHETTSLALSWFWMLMDQHPEEEKKLHEELKAVLNGRAPGFADIPKLKYTKQLIEETMRLYPPAWTVGRRPVEDDVIDGYRIPKDSVLIFKYILVFIFLYF